MSMTMLRDDDPTTRKDGKRLSEINLVEEEWVAIKQLIKILEPFASGTELLEGSKYATISFMYDAITEITNGVISSNEINPEEIDLTNHTTIFDHDIGIEDPDDDDEIDDHPKRRKISINIPQDCNNLIGKVKSALYMAMDYYWNVPQDEGMIATFLDPRCKSLNFASDSQITRTKTLLREIYKEAKQDLGPIQQQQISQSPVNPLLQNIFSNRYRQERHDEIEEYAMIKETGFTTCPFKWWASQESRFPILSQLAKKYLAIPATSASSERLFSDAGNVMTVRRINLLPSTFEHLVFCKRNWSLVGKIFPESE
jgi:hAT family C-terminal dimerisation region